MKIAYLSRQVKEHILPHLPSFALRKGLLYRQPVEMILAGFDFETSDFVPEWFRVWVFVLPLYIPKEYIYYTYGRSLGDMKFWGRHDWYTMPAGSEEEVMGKVLQDIQRYGLPFLNRVYTPADMLREARKLAAGYDQYVLEVIAYSQVLVGEYQQALHSLQRLVQWCLKEEQKYEWMPAIRERAVLVQQALRRNPSEAVELLHQWRDDTLQHLRLAASDKKSNED